MRLLGGCLTALLVAACDSGGGSMDALGPGDGSPRDSTAASAESASASAPASDASLADGLTNGLSDAGATPTTQLDCGASTRTTNVTGTVGGVPVGSTESIAVYGMDSVSLTPYAGVLIWSQAGACGLVQSGMGVPLGATVLTIELARTDGTSTPIAPGTYVISAENGGSANGIAMFVHFAAYDATCNQTLADGVGGVVAIDAVCGGRVAGSFQLDLNIGIGDSGVDRVTGTFDAPVCNFDMSTFDPNTPPAACAIMTGDP